MGKKKMFKAKLANEKEKESKEEKAGMKELEFIYQCSIS
jgi:hypothetical protein